MNRFDNYNNIIKQIQNCIYLYMIMAVIGNVCTGLGLFFLSKENFSVYFTFYGYLVNLVAVTSLPWDLWPIMDFKNGTDIFWFQAYCIVAFFTFFLPVLFATIFTRNLTIFVNRISLNVFEFFNSVLPRCFFGTYGPFRSRICHDNLQKWKAIPNQQFMNDWSEENKAMDYFLLSE